MKTLAERLDAAIKAAEALLAKPDRTAEETAQLAAHIAEGKTLKAAIEQARELETVKAWANQSAGMLSLVDATKATNGETEAAAAKELTVTKAAEDQSWGKENGFGHMLQAVKSAGMPGGYVDPRLSIKAATGASETVPSDGGFLVNVDISAELLKHTYDTAVLVGKTRRIPVSPNSNGVRINAVDETSRANGSRWGGVQVYWADEAAALTASRPKFRRLELQLHKLTGLFYATDELLQDTAALEATAMMAFSEEFAFKIDDALIRGTGAGQPLGILNASATVSVAKETGQAAATVVYENVKKMWSRCFARSRMKAEWFINQDIEPELYAMSLAVGTGGVPVYMPAGGISGLPYGTLFGRPVTPLEQAATLGTVGDLILADFSQYIMIEKGGMQAASSIHVRFLNDESVFRFTLRTDGQPIWTNALTPAQGSNTLSPFVTLATRA